MIECSVQIGSNDSASSERMTNLLDKSFFTWNSLVSVPKISKEYTSKHFGQISSFLKNFSMGKTFISYDWRVTNFLWKSAFTLIDLESTAKIFAEFNPNHWQTFSFLANFQFFFKNFSKDQTFTFHGWAFCPNWLKWIVLPLKRRPIT